MTYFHGNSGYIVTFLGIIPEETGKLIRKAKVVFRIIVTRTMKAYFCSRKFEIKYEYRICKPFKISHFLIFHIVLMAPNNVIPIYI